MTVFQDNSQYKYRATFKTMKQVELENGRTVTKPVVNFRRWAKYQTVTQKFRNAVIGFNETTDTIINIREIHKDPIHPGMDKEIYQVEVQGVDYRIYSVLPNLRLGGQGYHIITLRKIEQAI